MNIRSRITTTFLLFATTQTIVFAFLLDGLMTAVEDETSRDFLLENMAYFEERVKYELEKDTLISTPRIKAYVTHSNNAPAKLTSLPDGFHETEEAHILVKTLESGFYSGEKLILAYDESKSFLERNEDEIMLAISIFCVAIVVLAGFVCIYLAKSIATPIELLANTVSSEQGNISDCPVLLRHDELGSLAREFSVSVEQIQATLEREKNFTRYASHELRTPLAAVKNNIDLIQVVIKRLAKDQLQQENKTSKTYHKSIIRLNQATWFMEQQINTLLLLARGEYLPKIDELSLSPLINDIEAYFPDITLNKVFSKDIRILTDRTVFLGILVNIFNNVIEHGANDYGKAMATLEANAVGFSIFNNVSKRSTSSNGQRFGLEIAAQLCNAMNWQVKFTENNSKFFIHVSYSKPSMSFG